MPNRILKDSICTSDNLDRLTADEEVFWYRLLVQCDDYGRLDARPAILRARCYPLRLSTVSEQDVIKWLSALASANLIHLYTIADKPYLQVATWEKHQQVRAKCSKYPPMKESDSNGNQLIANAPVVVFVNEYEDVIAAARAQPSVPKSQKEREPSATYRIAETLAEVCKMDLAANKGRLLKEATILLKAKPPATPDLLRDHYNGGGWWWHNDWRGQRREFPQPATIRETWGKWGLEAPEVPPCAAEVYR